MRSGERSEVRKSLEGRALKDRAGETWQRGRGNPRKENRRQAGKARIPLPCKVLGC